MFSLDSSAVESEATDTRSLLDQAQAGDCDAFGEVCRVYETRLLRRALTICGNPALAEDLTQDTLVEAWRCIDRYNGRCQFFTWLCAILFNRYRSTVREKRPMPLSSLSGQDRDACQRRLEGLTDQETLPDRASELREQATLVLECIGALPKKHQQVIYLRFYVDDSMHGIAAALGCSVGTVKSRLFRALEKLRAMNLLSVRSRDCEKKVGSL